MSYLLTVPDELVAAATDLARIGSSISAANVSVGPLTTAIAAGLGDEYNRVGGFLIAPPAFENYTPGPYPRPR